MDSCGALALSSCCSRVRVPNHVYTHVLTQGAQVVLQHIKSCCNTSSHVAAHVMLQHLCACQRLEARRMSAGSGLVPWDGHGGWGQQSWRAAANTCHMRMSHEQHIGVLPNFNVSGNSNLQSGCSHRQGHPQELVACCRLLTCDRRDARCGASKCVEMRHSSDTAVGIGRKRQKEIYPSLLRVNIPFFGQIAKLVGGPSISTPTSFDASFWLACLYQVIKTRRQTLSHGAELAWLLVCHVAELPSLTSTPSLLHVKNPSLLIYPGPSSPVRTSAMVTDCARAARQSGVCWWNAKCTM